MRLEQQDPRTASEGSSSGPETQPRAGTEQTRLFTHAEATISPEAQKQLKEAREKLSVQVGLRKQGSVTDKGNAPNGGGGRYCRCSTGARSVGKSLVL
jgi:hypothetical protein